MVQKIHETPFKFFAAISGGGQGFLGDFCKIEGASNNFIGAIIPYNQNIFNKFLGGRSPDHYVSSEAARKLAVSSFMECLNANIPRQNAVGLAATCSLAKFNERENRKHKVYIAAHCYTFTLVIEIILNQHRRNRSSEDELVSNLLFEVLAYVTLAKPINIKPFYIDEENGESFKITEERDKNLGYLINGETDLISTVNLAETKELVIFSGSFNPIHNAHKEIVEAAQKITNQPVFLELTINNADKGFLDFIELENRINNLAGYEFILTNARTMKDKVDTIKKYAPKANLIFVVGSDTWERIWNPKYGFELHFLEQFFTNQNVRFIKFKRGGFVEKEISCGKNLLIQHDKINEPTKTISSSDIRKGLTT